jgi:nucleotide-binding universal stress UspA family protein
VVIPYLDACDGELITRIVQDTAIAVLAARSTHHGDGIVAATDLSDQQYPVLRQGLRIACGQVAPITFIHNVKPDTVASRTHRCIRRSLVSLEDIGRELGAKCARITANQTNTVDVILTVAETQGASLIVVGTHLNPRHERDRRRKSVARQVVEQATRSVMVVPVRGPGVHAGGARAR